MESHLRSVWQLPAAGQKLHDAVLNCRKLYRVWVIGKWVSVLFSARHRLARILLYLRTDEVARNRDAPETYSARGSRERLFCFSSCWLTAASCQLLGYEATMSSSRLANLQRPSRKRAQDGSIDIC